MSTFDLRLLLYVIRLAGWLKHCNLSLSLSVGHVLEVQAFSPLLIAGIVEHFTTISSQLSAVPFALRGCKEHLFPSAERARRSRSCFAFGNMLRCVPDGSSPAASTALAALPVGVVPVFTESDLSNDTHLHAYLASQLFEFGADTTNGPDKNKDTQQSHNSLSWRPVPFLPAAYRSEALSLFEDQAAVEYEDALSPSRLCDGELAVSTLTASSESQLVKDTASSSNQDAAVRQETGKKRKANIPLAPQVHMNCRPLKL